MWRMARCLDGMRRCLCVRECGGLPTPTSLEPSLGPGCAQCHSATELCPQLGVVRRVSASCYRPLSDQAVPSCSDLPVGL
eukprot:844297-Alexandrium_andersonii.AAC.1